MDDNHKKASTLLLGIIVAILIVGSQVIIPKIEEILVTLTMPQGFFLGGIFLILVALFFYKRTFRIMRVILKYSLERACLTLTAIAFALVFNQDSENLFLGILLFSFILPRSKIIISLLILGIALMAGPKRNDLYYLAVPILAITLPIILRFLPDEYKLAWKNLTST